MSDLHIIAQEIHEKLEVAYDSALPDVIASDEVRAIICYELCNKGLDADDYYPMISDAIEEMLD